MRKFITENSRQHIEKIKFENGSVIEPLESGTVTRGKGFIFMSMRDPERIQRILKLIQQIWEKQPDSRFMQMVSNISWDYSNEHNNDYKEYSYSKWETDNGIVFNKDVVNVDPYHLEDDNLEKFLEEYLEEM